jgi:hypothetical protein
MTGRVLGNPVLARQARIENAVAHVARHLLRAYQHAVDLRIVDCREIRPRARVDVEAGAGEELNRRVLQRTFRDTEAESRRFAHDRYSR